MTAAGAQPGARRRRRSTRLEARAYLPQLARQLLIERRRTMRLQQLAQIAIDARVEIGIGSARAAQRHVGPEVTAAPEMLAAMAHGMLLCQVVAAWPHGARQVQCQRVLIDLHALPHGAQQSRQVVAQQQRVQRVRQPLIERAQIVERRGAAEEALQHSRGELGDGVLVEAARTRVAGGAGEGGQRELAPHLAHHQVGERGLGEVADAARGRLHEADIRTADAEGAAAHELREHHGGKIGRQAVDDAAGGGDRRRGAADRQRADAHRHAGAHRLDELIGVHGVIVERQRRDDLQEVGLVEQLLSATADRGRHLDDHPERLRLLAQVLQRLHGIAGHDREFLDLAVDVRARDVLAGDTHRIDVLESVGHAAHGGEILAGAVARCTALQIVDLDAGHPGDEPGMAAVEVDGAGTVAVPQPGALRYRVQRIADALRIEAHHALIARRAAAAAQYPERLGARLEGNPGVAHENDRRVDQPLRLIGTDRRIRSGGSLVQPDIRRPLILRRGLSGTPAGPQCALHAAHPFNGGRRLRSRDRARSILASTTAGGPCGRKRT